MSTSEGMTAYPLTWPDGWKRTSYRQRSKSKTTFGRVRDELLHEIKLMRGSKTILSTNIPLRNDGLPYSNLREPTDPGVAVYFEFKGKRMVFACDKWKTATENAWAIKKTIEALRGIERWGASDMMERAFTGLPPGKSHVEETWWEIFGFDRPTTNVDQIKARRNELARKYHPDIGEQANPHMMTKINWAYEQATKDL